MKKALSIILIAAVLLTYTIAVFADYENTYVNTDSYSDDIVEVAKTQIGYVSEDSQSKYIDSEDGDIASWNAAFIAWCAYEAAIPDDIIPKMASAAQLYEFFADSGLITDNDGYVPSKGDIAFFGSEDEITACGIAEDCDGTYVTLIMGDVDKAVQEQMYTVDAPAIFAYASPAYGNNIEEDSSDAEETSDIEDNTEEPEEDNTDIDDDNGNTDDNNDNDDVEDDIITVDAYITLASYLNFRTGPSTSYSIITQIPLCTILTITETSNGWGKTEYNGSEGWVSMSYVAEYKDTYSLSGDYAVHWTVLDISKWQGEIDWDKIAQSDVDAVIIRIGLRGSKSREILIDDMFDEYYQGATGAGLHVGCYFYTTAATETEAQAEAEFIIDTIRDGGYEFDMPIFYDMEDSVTEAAGKTAIRKITTAFCETLEEANFYTGVYCSSSWAESYYTPDMFINRALWIADWRGECAYTDDYEMWQFTDMGSISGIQTDDTDISICYFDFPTYITEHHYNIILEVDANGSLGDVDGDGKISVADARLVLRYAAGLDAFTEEQAANADIDGNGTVSAADARKLLRIAAKIETI
ncbi:MAG: SH3 domain-containing protein [Clostridiales bacterium]|nr:SH3 domain-containing protein [Clostridiales bacterium]